MTDDLNALVREVYARTSVTWGVDDDRASANAALRRLLAGEPIPDPTPEADPTDQMPYGDGHGDGGKGNGNTHRGKPTRSLNDLIREAHGL